MQRRQFLTTLAAASTQALAQSSPVAAASGASPRLFYELRKYHLAAGPQMLKLTEAYLSQALIPALARLGIGPIGAFRLDYGPETPTLYLLIPAPSLDTIVSLPTTLAHDQEFLKLAEPFNTVPALTPAFLRIESSLLLAFEGFPAIHLPADPHAKRIFQLRIYENPTPQAHARKLEQFHQGEWDIFQRVGMAPVFFADTLIGPRMPNLTYMLTFKDLAALEAGWQAFSADPAWQKLRALPRYASEATVSNITNLVLTPTPYSQI